MIRRLVALNCVVVLVGLPSLRAEDLRFPLTFADSGTGVPSFDSTAGSDGLPVAVDLTTTSNLSLSGWSVPAAAGEDGDGEEGGRGDGPKQFAGLKLGALWGTDDLHDLDEIFYSELFFGRYLIGELLALEGDIGFFYADEDIGAADVEFWGMPLFVNARADINILFLDIYGGLGIGGVYVHGEIDTPGGDDKDDDFVLAADFFAGLLAKFGRLFFGVETKYIVTDKTDAGADITGINLTGTVGFLF